MHSGLFDARPRRTLDRSCLSGAFIVWVATLLVIRSCDRAAAHGVLRLPPTIHSTIRTMPRIVKATAPDFRNFGYTLLDGDKSKTP